MLTQSLCDACDKKLATLHPPSHIFLKYKVPPASSKLHKFNLIPTLQGWGQTSFISLIIFRWKETWRSRMQWVLHQIIYWNQIQMSQLHCRALWKVWETHFPLGTSSPALHHATCCTQYSVSENGSITRVSSRQMVPNGRHQRNCDHSIQWEHCCTHEEHLQVHGLATQHSSVQCILHQTLWVVGFEFLQFWIEILPILQNF
jgi:hypothetical protein